MDYKNIVKFENLGEGEAQALKQVLAPDFVEEEAQWWNGKQITGIIKRKERLNQVSSKY